MTTNRRKPSEQDLSRQNGHFATKAEKLAMIAAETATVAATAPAPIEEVIVYKGFSKRADDTIHCRGHEFEIGKEYSVEGDPRACHHGFHGCEKLFDVFRYYPLDSFHTFGRANLSARSHAAMIKSPAKAL